MAEHEPLTAVILKDVFDGIEHFYGKEGLEQVAEFAMLKNRSRESNRVMDELEAAFPSTERK
jgi:hypothetical protein